MATRDTSVCVFGVLLMAFTTTLCLADPSEMDERLRVQLDALAERFRKRNSRCEAFLMLKTGQWRLDDRNLVQNPGFEVINDDGVPKKWGRTPEMSLNEGAKIDTVEQASPHDRLGSRSGRISVEGTAYLLGSAPGVKPDLLYYAEAEAKLTSTKGGVPSDARIFLLVKWFGPNGWIIEPEMEFRSPATRTRDEWVSLGLVVKTPLNATQAKVFLQVENMRMDEEEARFDNVSLRRIVTP